MFTPTLRSLVARLPSTTSFTGNFLYPSLISSTQTATSISRSIHTTAPQNARAQGGSKDGGRKKSKKRKGEAPDPRIMNLKSSMPRAVPAPLRFARNRALRHWTIHRAWLLHQRKEREREGHELERMYQSMHNACEELRKTSGPGTRDEGYLYRVAMEKKGAYGYNSVPIEYARPQTETPAREPWNHGWTR
ncbi:hypothetical protein M426DRAFT_319804 [Hypoxylon sp. CI-4A]|nr:hypothetical protein M426DRAFT_319804 [Hypoxylon sp. CI-4A]